MRKITECKFFVMKDNSGFSVYHFWDSKNEDTLCGSLKKRKSGIKNIEKWTVSDFPTGSSVCAFCRDANQYHKIIFPEVVNSHFLMNFGKHKGKRIEDVDDGYLYWIIGNCYFTEAVDAAKRELSFRGIKPLAIKPKDKKRWKIITFFRSLISKSSKVEATE